MGKITVDWAVVLVGAIGVVGFMEWFKGYFKNPKPWMLRTLLVPICVGVALFPDGGWGQVGINAVLILSICQIGYETILANVKKLVENKVGK